MGLLVIGTAAARQLGKDPDGKPRLFQAEQSRGAFWWCLSILQAGGITIDQKLGNRIFLGLTVNNEKIKDNPVGDTTMPFKLGELAAANGYFPGLSEAFGEMLQRERMLSFSAVLVISLVMRLRDQDERLAYDIVRQYSRLVDLGQRCRHVIDRLSDAGLLVRNLPRRFYDSRDLPPFEYFFERFRMDRPFERVSELMWRLSVCCGGTCLRSLTSLCVT